MTLPARHRRPEREEGVALVVVLWAVTLLALLVLSFTTSVRSAVSLARSELMLARADAALAAGLELAGLRFAEPDPQRRPRADGTELFFTTGPARITVTARDTSGLIDINRADPRLLEGFFRRIADNPDLAKKLADEIVDWRDRDQQRRPLGAEDPEYRRAGRPLGTGDAPFLDVTDLALVLSMTPAIAARAAPFVTVFGRDGRINPAVAPPEVLRAIPGLSEAEVAAILAQRSRGADARALAQLLPNAAAFLSAAPGTVYLIGIEVEGEGVARSAAAATIVVRIDSEAAYRVLDWRHVRPGTAARGGSS